MKAHFLFLKRNTTFSFQLCLVYFDILLKNPIKKGKKRGEKRNKKKSLAHCTSEKNSLHLSMFCLRITEELKEGLYPHSFLLLLLSTAEFTNQMQGIIKTCHNVSYSLLCIYSWELCKKVSTSFTTPPICIFPHLFFSPHLNESIQCLLMVIIVIYI